MTDADQTRDEAVASATGEGRFQVSVSSGGAHFFADEPVESGGLGSGPTPYQLLASALAACTTMTLRLYAQHKGWPVTGIRTSVGHQRQGADNLRDVFKRSISFEGNLEPDQRSRLLEIADRCPVHRTLATGADVETVSRENVARSGSAADHMVDMEALISVGRGSYDFTE